MRTSYKRYRFVQDRLVVRFSSWQSYKLVTSSHCELSITVLQYSLPSYSYDRVILMF